MAFLCACLSPYSAKRFRLRELLTVRYDLPSMLEMVERATAIWGYDKVVLHEYAESVIVDQ